MCYHFFLDRSQKKTADHGELVFLNFRVTEAFRREWKAYAASRGLHSTDLLQRAFEVLKKADKQKLT